MKLPDIAGSLLTTLPFRPGTDKPKIRNLPLTPWNDNLDISQLGGLPDIYISPPPSFAPPPQARPLVTPTGVKNSGPYPAAVPAHGFLQLPTRWSGTHVTDGLGWGTKTAHDFMAPAGTRVGAPVGGTILYFHPNGAQGGGSMELRGDDGRLYWLGHLDNGRPGGRVRKGEVIALVSSRHPAPHVHIDVR